MIITIINLWQESLAGGKHKVSTDNVFNPIQNNYNKLCNNNNNYIFSKKFTTKSHTAAFEILFADINI